MGFFHFRRFRHVFVPPFALLLVTSLPTCSTPLPFCGMVNVHNSKTMNYWDWNGSKFPDLLVLGDFGNMTSKTTKKARIVLLKQAQNFGERRGKRLKKKRMSLQKRKARSSIMARKRRSGFMIPLENSSCNGRWRFSASLGRPLAPTFRTGRA